jgi:hypothetical protein
VRKIQIAILVLTLAALGAAQTSNVPNYENHNMIDYGPLVFRSISGVIIDPTGVAMPGGSIGLFTEHDHKLLANSTTDTNGSFTLQHVFPGRYRLVAHFDGFCPANVRIEIVSWPRGGLKRKLVIHGVLPAIDSCSYGAYK